MNAVEALLGHDLAVQWRRAFIRFAVVSVLLQTLAWSAAKRVAGVDPRVATFSFPVTAFLVALVTLAAGGVILALVLLSLKGLLNAVRKRRGAVDPSPAGTLALLILGVLAILVVPGLLAMPLRTSEGEVHIPLLSGAIYRYALPVGLLLLVEIGLSLAALGLTRTSLWWRARFIVGLAWCAVLAWIITGPNLLKGDPLEWAAAVRGSNIPQRWMNLAPRSLESWWPALQIVLAAILLSVGLLIVRDLDAIRRSFQKAPKSLAAPPP